MCIHTHTTPVHRRGEEGEERRGRGEEGGGGGRRGGGGGRRGEEGRGRGEEGGGEEGEGEEGRRGGGGGEKERRGRGEEGEGEEGEGGGGGRRGGGGGRRGGEGEGVRRFMSNGGPVGELHPLNVTHSAHGMRVGAGLVYLGQLNGFSLVVIPCHDGAVYIQGTAQQSCDSHMTVT